VKTNFEENFKTFKDMIKSGETVHINSCAICTSTEGNILICSNCSVGLHPTCVVSKKKVEYDPENTLNWICPTCKKQSNDQFGYKEWDSFSLNDFKTSADMYRGNYFVNKEKDPTLQDIEEEYWKIVQNGTKPIEVAYGSEIPAQKHSGFNCDSGKVANHDFNLMNLQNAKDNIISFLGRDISGMSYPWIYVGMMFSTFCWHNEDHYGYSVNFNHIGAPKQWYGVPGSSADKFEEVFGKVFPEMLKVQPHLLFHLITQLAPTTLKNNGCDVYKAIQRSGEFVVTFPKAYHGGFNYGFNVAEAVNFLTVDWFKWGLDCDERYMQLHRIPAFSFVELLTKYSQKKDLKLYELCRILEPLIKVRNNNQNAFSQLINSGIKKSRPWSFDPHCAKLFEDTKTIDLSTDSKLQEEDGANRNKAYERLNIDYHDSECKECKNCLYLLNVRCSCQQNSVFCHRHLPKCNCKLEEKWFEFRFTQTGLDEVLQSVIDRIKDMDPDYDIESKTKLIDRSKDDDLEKLRLEGCEEFSKSTILDWANEETLAKSINAFEDFEELKEISGKLEPYLWLGTVKKLDEAYKPISKTLNAAKAIIHAHNLLCKKQTDIHPPKIIWDKFRGHLDYVKNQTNLPFLDEYLRELEPITTEISSMVGQLTQNGLDKLTLKEILNHDHVRNIHTELIQTARQRLEYLGKCELTKGYMPTDSWIGAEVIVEYEGSFYDSVIVSVKSDTEICVRYVSDDTEEIIVINEVNFGFKHAQLLPVKKKRRKKRKRSSNNSSDGPHRKKVKLESSENKVLEENLKEIRNGKSVTYLEFKGLYAQCKDVEKPSKQMQKQIDAMHIYFREIREYIRDAENCVNEYNKGMDVYDECERLLAFVASSDVADLPKVEIIKKIYRSTDLVQKAASLVDVDDINTNLSELEFLRDELERYKDLPQINDFVGKLSRNLRHIKNERREREEVVDLTDETPKKRKHEESGKKKKKKSKKRKVVIELD